MKTKILTLVFLLVAMMGFAQQTSEHLSFKGVLIDGTLDSYVSKMKQNGFTELSKENGVALLGGDFAGYKDCIIGVATLKQKDLVYKIGVIFPEKDTWSTLFGDYADLKQMLTEKYGKPSEVVEKFDGSSSSQLKDDFSKMHELKMDRCKYYSIWKTDKGDIQLSIDHESMKSCFVKLAYFDKINSNVIRAKAKGDL